MNSHSPGPWTYQNNPGAGLEVFAPVGVLCDRTDRHPSDVPLMIFGLRPADSAKTLIGYERWTQFPTKEWDAMQECNARLIAAAPDLLAACKGILTSWDNGGVNCERAMALVRAAIDKAESSAVS